MSIEPVCMTHVPLIYRGRNLGYVQVADDVIVGVNEGTEWAYGLDVIDAMMYYSKNLYQE